MSEPVTRAFIPYELSPGDKQYICLVFKGKITRKNVKAKVREYIKQAFNKDVPYVFINHDCQYDWPDASAKEYVSMRQKLEAFNQWLDIVDKEGKDEAAKIGGLATGETSTTEVTGLPVCTMPDGLSS